MRISKHFYNLEGENRYNGISIGDNNFHREQFMFVTEKEFFKAYNSNLIQREKIKLTSEGFTRVDGPRCFHMPFQFPEDMIQYTECFYYHAMTGVHITSDNDYRLHLQGVITLTFDGPDELGLIWRLSI